jgi:hypothetical protein
MPECCAAHQYPAGSAGGSSAGFRRLGGEGQELVASLADYPVAGLGHLDPGLGEVTHWLGDHQPGVVGRLAQDLPVRSQLPEAAETTRPSPATGAIVSSTPAISSLVAPAASARPALHSRHTAGDPRATGAAIAAAPRSWDPGPMPRLDQAPSSSSKPSSITARLRTFPAKGTQHVIYQGDDDHIHELWCG